MTLRNVLMISCAAALLVGCSAVAEKTNMLNDEDIKKETAGVIGVSPSELTVVESYTTGTNTHATLRTTSGKQYICTVNGGNLLSFGMVNPPTCNPK